jgi:FSR family fosmidomycin resistance protein-like MFS transporter
MSFAMQGPYAAFVVLGQSYLAKSIGSASGITLGLSFSVGGIIVPVLGKYADTYGIYSVMVLVVIISAAAAASTFLLPKPKNTCK